MVQVYRVPIEHLDAAWVHAAPILERATRRGGNRYRIEDLYDILQKELQSLWIAIRQEGDDEAEMVGVGTLSINQYPGKAVVSRIEFIAGHSREDWFRPMWDEMVAYSKAYGCEALECIARPGLRKYFQSYGGRHTADFLEINLKKE